MAVVQVNGRSPNEPLPSKRDVWQSLWRGARQACPKCGEGSLFARYLTVEDRCPTCGEELYHQRADDAPPYFVTLLIGHLIIALVLIVEVTYQPAVWVHAIIWLPLTLALVLISLPPIKGALIGLQWALFMHGFDPNENTDEDPHIDYKVLIANEKHG